MKTARIPRGSMLLSCLLALALAFGLNPAFAVAQPADGATGATDAWAASLEAAWPSYGGENAGMAEGALPMTEQSAQAAWQQTLVRTPGAYANASDPLVIDGTVYTVESDSIWNADGTSEVTPAIVRAYDAQTGVLVKSKDLPYALDSVCHMAYADGVIAVPTAGGGLAGIDAGTLELLWFVPAELDGAQSLNKVSVHDGKFVHTYSQLDANWQAAASVTVMVDPQAADNPALWSAEGATGSYWSGYAFVGDVAVAGTDAGTLRTLNAENGEVLGETRVTDGAAVRSVPVNWGDDEVVFSTADGQLVKARVGANGSVQVTGRVQFAASSTCTPAIADGTAVVGGATAEYAGVLAEVDLDAMTVTAAHAAMADVKSAPVVAQGADDAFYAYFTCNSMPGALFGVRLGDATAQPFTVFEPAQADRNYCMASPTADGQGHLFYTNDAGVLFAVSHDPTCGYADVQPGDWYVQDGLLERAVAQGLIGVGSAEFRPTDVLTRAEVVTVLYRAAGEPAYQAGAGFADVPEGAWHHDAVLWAQASGVAQGYGDTGMFGPDDAVTREQLAKMLLDFARLQSQGAEVTVDASVLDAFPDEGTVDEWAREGMAWCVANGVVSGVPVDGVNTLSPLAGADRAMMAKMILQTLDVVA